MTEGSLGGDRLFDAPPPLRPEEDPAFDPRSVECPTCGARVGSPCRRPSGHNVFGSGVHAGRDRIALEQARARREG